MFKIVASSPDGTGGGEVCFDMEEGWYLGTKPPRLFKSRAEANRTIREWFQDWLEDVTGRTLKVVPVAGSSRIRKPR